MARMLLPLDGMSGLREAYQGYVIEADPIRRGDRWQARAVLELRDQHGVNYQEVAGDPFVTYATREEAERASIAFGKAILDSQLAAR